MDDAHAIRTVLCSGPPEAIALSREPGLPLVGLAAVPGMARYVERRRGPARDGHAPPFSQIVVLGDLDAAAEAWRSLEALAPASPYQTLAWARAWMASEGRTIGAEASIAIAFGERGEPIALLPFCVTRRGLLRIARFLGGRHSNYNLGLFDPARAWSAADVRHLMRIVSDLAGRIDVFALVNQPVLWEGWHNPLALLPHQASPSDGHSGVLDGDGEDFLKRHLSGNARKKLRQKSKQLATVGPLKHVVARSPDEVEAVLNAYMVQKEAKFRALGLPTDDAAFAAARSLYVTSALGPAPALECHALFCGDTIVSTFGGVAHRGRFSGQFISYDANPRFAPHSPGEILLTTLIAAKCDAGFVHFDLGIGEARYKESLCRVVDTLVDTLVSVTLAGHAFVAAERIRLRVKRAIKRSAWAWPLALKTRRWIAALRRDG